MRLLEHRKVFKIWGKLVIMLSRGWLAFFDIKVGGPVKIVANRDLLIRALQVEESGLQPLPCQLTVWDVSTVRGRYAKRR